MESSLKKGILQKETIEIYQNLAKTKTKDLKNHEIISGITFSYL